MIDLLVVQGMPKRWELADIGRAAQVGFLQTYGTKLKAGIEYVASPLSGSQLELTVSADRAHEELLARFKLPLASALLGQNWMHGWTENLNDELRAASRLIRVILMYYQFRSDEIDRFFATARVLSAELTWHIRTDSYRAAQNLLMRVYRLIKVLHAHKRFHDIGIEGYSFQDINQRVSLKVYLKNGSAMKFYVKVDEMSDSSRRKNRGTALHASHRPKTETVREEIGAHLRVEAIPGEKHLRERDASNPASWTPELLESIVQEILSLAGLSTPYVPDVRLVDTSGLSARMQRTLLQYRENGAVLGVSASTASRHREKLLLRGVDIGIPPSDHRELNGNVGKQVHFSKRWKAPAPMRNFMMSEVTLPTLTSTLEAMAEGVSRELTPEKLSELEDARRRDAVPGKTRPRQREASASGFASSDQLR
jgi:hypothetical protein